MTNQTKLEFGDQCLAQQLNQLLQRLAPEVAQTTALFIPRLLDSHRQGNSCLPLSKKEAEILSKCSPLVNYSGGISPLILQKFGQKNYLYFATHHLFECQLAARLIALSNKQDDVCFTQAKDILDKLFSENSQQKLAAALALRKHFLLIAGGPGTGKTSTVVRFIAALIGLQNKAKRKPLNIIMAAPTGKAAARLSDALKNNLAKLNLGSDVLIQMPKKSYTLHRLLGSRRDGGKVKFNANNPLSLDVLIIDEASMVDLQLMTQTINALPANARLILLGDSQQLSAVGIGSVLSDICCFAGYSGEMLAWLNKVLCEQELIANSENKPLADCVVTLQTSHRFTSDSSIGKLSFAVNDKNSQQVLAVFDDLLQPDIFWESSRENLINSKFEYYKKYFSALDSGSISQAFAAFERFTFLCVEKKDVDYLNQQVANKFESELRKEKNNDWYAGRAVMVNKNDYSLNLFNGDIGLTLMNDNEMQVYFSDEYGAYRAISTSRLTNNVDSAFAMTVHKSQGSEFEKVCLLLPEKNNNNLLERSLIYTAITRAKKTFSICGSADILSETILRDSSRVSGLSRHILRLFNEKKP